MYGIETTIEQARREVAWRNGIKSQNCLILQLNRVLVILSQVPGSLILADQDVDTRWEAFKTENGWNVYLVAYFKAKDARLVFYFDLERGAPSREERIAALTHLVEHGGLWAIGRHACEMAAATGVPFSVNGNLLSLPKIADLEGLKKVVEVSRVAMS